ncbi:MAG: hypothetical protein IKI57_02700 [Clostridia bacterium]|nr:hypothetical protein [Clostridia bacterium]
MKRIDSKYLNMKEIQNILDVSTAEIDALSSYKGAISYRNLNQMLGIFSPSYDRLSDKNRTLREQSKVPSSIPKDLYYLGESEEAIKSEIRKIIDMATKLYSSMYKDTIARYSTYGQYASQRLGRGSSHSLLSSNTSGFISTSSLDRSGRVNSYQESMDWATSNNLHASNHVLSKINVSSDVPLIYVGNYVDGDYHEREVLISPFVQIEKDELSGRFSNGEIMANGKRIREEYVQIKNKPLSKMTIEEQKSLEDALFSTAKDFDQNMVSSIIIQKEIESLYDKLERDKKLFLSSQDGEMEAIKQARLSGRQDLVEKYQKSMRDNRAAYEENQKRYQEQIDSLTQQMKSSKDMTIKWQEDLRKLVEAKCADIEANIDKQIDVVLDPIINKEEYERKAKEERKRIEQEISKTKLETGTQNAIVLSDAIDKSIDKVCQSKEYNALMRHRDRYKRAGIQMTTQIDALSFAIDGIGNLSPIDFLSEDCEQMMKQKNQRGISFSDSLANLSEAVKNNANSIAVQTDNEFKCAMMSRVLSVRGVQEYRLLEGNQRQIENQKIGMFGRSKKEQEKQHSLEMISAKKNEVNAFISNIQKYGLDTTKEYSARDIMAEIITAEKGPLTEQERKNLQEVRYLLNAVFDINQPGIDKRVAENDILYGNPNRATEFLKKFDIEKGYVNRRMTPTPVHPLVKFAKDMQITISNVKNRSDREHVELLRKSRESNLPFKPMDEMEH